LQALVENKNKLSLEALLDDCRQRHQTDCKLLFMRAATAAGLLQTQKELCDPLVRPALEGIDARYSLA